MAGPADKFTASFRLTKNTQKETDEKIGTFEVVRFHAVEAISEPFTVRIDLLSSDAKIEPDDLLDQEASLAVQGYSGASREFNGIVASVELGGQSDDNLQWLYTVVLAPRLWRLSLHRKPEIFGPTPTVTVRDIANRLLLDQGRAAYPKDAVDIRLDGSYRARDFVVKYAETDLDFLKRQFEHHGIFFIPVHAQGDEKLLIADANGYFRPISGTGELPEDRNAATGGAGSDGKAAPGESVLPYAQTAGAVGEKATLQRMVAVRGQVPDQVAVQDYNYETPGVDNRGEAAIVADGSRVWEEFGDNFQGPDPDGKDLAAVRAAAAVTAAHRFRGVCDAVTMRAGGTFTPSKHPRPSLNREMLVVRCEHSCVMAAAARVPELEDLGAPGYEVRFEAQALMDGKTPIAYRPPRVTPKPRIHGVMSGFIDSGMLDDGRAHVDSQGRYGLAVPFDTDPGRVGGKRSAPVRMAQPYGGQGAGMHFPLRNGTEVLWSCIDGDPDRPVILGAAPNPDSPSVTRDANRTRNLLRTHSGITLEINDGRILRAPAVGADGTGTLPTPAAQTASDAKWFSVSVPQFEPDSNSAYLRMGSPDPEASMETSARLVLDEAVDYGVYQRSTQGIATLAQGARHDMVIMRDYDPDKASGERATVAATGTAVEAAQPKEDAKLSAVSGPMIEPVNELLAEAGDLRRFFDRLHKDAGDASGPRKGQEHELAAQMRRSFANSLVHKAAYMIQLSEQLKAVLDGFSTHLSETADLDLNDDNTLALLVKTSDTIQAVLDLLAKLIIVHSALARDLERATDAFLASDAGPSPEERAGIIGIETDEDYRLFHLNRHLVAVTNRLKENRYVLDKITEAVEETAGLADYVDQLIDGSEGLGRRVTATEFANPIRDRVATLHRRAQQFGEILNQQLAPKDGPDPLDPTGGASATGPAQEIDANIKALTAANGKLEALTGTVVVRLKTPGYLTGKSDLLTHVIEDTEGMKMALAGDVLAGDLLSAALVRRMAAGGETIVSQHVHQANDVKFNIVRDYAVSEHTHLGPSTTNYFNGATMTYLLGKTEISRATNLSIADAHTQVSTGDSQAFTKGNHYQWTADNFTSEANDQVLVGGSSLTLKVLGPHSPPPKRRFAPIRNLRARWNKSMIGRWLPSSAPRPGTRLDGKTPHGVNTMAGVSQARVLEMALTSVANPSDSDRTKSTVGSGTIKAILGLLSLSTASFASTYAARNGKSARTDTISPEGSFWDPVVFSNLRKVATKLKFKGNTGFVSDYKPASEIHLNDTGISLKSGDAELALSSNGVIELTSSRNNKPTAVLRLDPDGGLEFNGQKMEVIAEKLFKVSHAKTGGKQTLEFAKKLVVKTDAAIDFKADHFKVQGDKEVRIQGQAINAKN